MKRFLVHSLLVLALAAPIFGQEAATGPQPKSQAELDTLLAIQNAPDADSRIEASQKLLTDFTDSDFKEFALNMIMVSYQEKNDFENMLVYGERALEENAENVQVLVQLAVAIPMRTREFDLDKEEKLSKAESYAQRAIKILPTLESPNPNMTPEQWLLVKKDAMSQSHEALGSVALARKNFTEAETSFRQALTVAGEQNPLTFLKLGQSLMEQGKYDEAITVLDKAIALGGVPTPTGGDLAALFKQDVIKLKESGAPPPSQQQQSTSDVPQVEIVQ